MDRAAHGYQSNAGNEQLRQAITSWYKKFYQVDLNPDDQVLPLQGSRQGIIQISQALLSKGDQVLVPNPGYPSYTFAARFLDARPVLYDLSPENAYLPIIEQLEEKVNSKTKILWINYPHMPTGAVASKEYMQKLTDFAIKNNVLIINDNAYGLINNPGQISLLQAEGALETALELNSLSKNYHMAGWRMGFFAGSQKVIAHLLKLKSNLDSGIALPLQKASATALNLGENWVDGLQKVYSERRKKALELAKILGCQPAGGQAGLFLWVSMPETMMKSKDFVKEMLNNAGVLLAPGSLFGNAGEGHLRISLCGGLALFDQAINNIQKSLINLHKSN
ncbi:MAG: pyridoxal phosphate-dependent aminotransferase [Bacteroidota bacterium]